MAICIMKLNNPEINEVIKTFGFEMKDLTGKPVVISKPSRRRAPRSNKKRR
jgi:hypothetical protein